ncbi:DUF6442 family protein [Paraclostridium bifermentans]|uniref:DUF6442 family protein n=1 Tax=Paraclostridium bifermentans TaxID=1490 RepID=UPI00374EC0A5
MNNKEEILKRSRNSKRDEGMEFVENKGRTIGFRALCVIFIFIVLFNSFMGKRSDEVSALFWAYLAFESIPKYKFTHEKAYLVTTIFGIIASLASLLNFILTSLR